MVEGLQPPQSKRPCAGENPSVHGPLQKDKSAGPQGGRMSLYRDIAALSAAQVVFFLLLSHLEPSFFLLHFYQTIVYLAILIMLFYMEDRWAYMIGIVAPALWLVMTFATGLLQGALRQLLQLSEGKG